MIIKRKAVYDNILSIPAGTRGAFTVEHVAHPAGHVFSLATARTRIMGGHAGGRVSYDHPTTWHRLTEENRVWMSDYPIEQAQHDRELAGVRHGRVLIGGLGLGYAATILSRRGGVREVVIVEKARDVVDLVAPHLVADDAAARAKLTIVCADLFDYLRELPACHRFEHAFYDIWASDGEGTFFQTVVPLLRLSQGRVHAAPICWNESVMRGQLFHSLQGRWLSLSMPHAGAATLDKLCELTGSFWLTWSAPFFRWARAARPDVARFDEMAGLYAGAYGRPSFLDTWQLVAGETVPELEVSADA